MQGFWSLSRITTATLTALSTPVRFVEAIYVLHCFKKKSKRGIKTPKHVIDLIGARLQRAEEDYQQWLRERDA